MNVVIRVDSSAKIGSGHVMRCLTLAKELKKNGNVKFISRDRKGDLINKIELEGFQVIKLDKRANDEVEESSDLYWLGVSQEEDALESEHIIKKIKPDWLIVDNYGIGNYWHKRLKNFSKKLLVIDDLANRKYNCDLLLDQNYYEDAFLRYKDLINNDCNLILGPKYALLREEFLDINDTNKNKEIKRILVYFGGSDLNNNTLKSLEAINLSKKNDLYVDVIINNQSPFKEKIEKYASGMKRTICYDFIDNMADLMNKASLYIGSAGTTTWERCCVGLPSIVIAISENQVEPMKAMEKAGMSFFLGKDENITSLEILKKLNHIFEDPLVLKKMQNKSQSLVDGNGTFRCVEEMKKNV